MCIEYIWKDIKETEKENGVDEEQDFSMYIFLYFLNSEFLPVQKN